MTAGIVETEREELERLRRRERFYCPLGREMNLEMVRLRALNGEERAEDRDLLREEVDQLHREREWLAEQLAAAIDRPLRDVRIMMRRQFSETYALVDRTSDEQGVVTHGQHS